MLAATAIRGHQADPLHVTELDYEDGDILGIVGVRDEDRWLAVHLTTKKQQPGRFFVDATKLARLPRLNSKDEPEFLNDGTRILYYGTD